MYLPVILTGEFEYKWSTCGQNSNNKQLQIGPEWCLKMASFADGLLVDELLCFVQNKISLIDHDAVVKLCTDFYSEEAIVASKKTLVDLKVYKGQERIIQRKGPKKNETNVSDIIEILNSAGEDVPKFVAYNLNNLPPLSMSSIDISTLMKKMDKTIQDVKGLTSTCQGQDEVNSEVISLCVNLGKRLDTLEKKSSISVTDHDSEEDIQQLVSEKLRDLRYGNNITEVLGRHSVRNKENGLQSRITENEIPVHLLSGETESPTTGDVTVDPIDDENEKVPEEPSFAAITQKNLDKKDDKSTESCDSALDSTEKIQFKEPPSDGNAWNYQVKYDSRRRMKYSKDSDASINPGGAKKAKTSNQSVPPKTNSGWVGRAQGSTLRAASRDKKLSLFATRFDTKITAEQLVAHLKEKTSLEVSAHKLVTHSKRYNSFRINCYCEDPDILCDPEVWPDDIYVRHWQEKIVVNGEADEHRNNGD